MKSKGNDKMFSTEDINHMKIISDLFDGSFTKAKNYCDYLEEIKDKHNKILEN